MFGMCETKHSCISYVWRAVKLLSASAAATAAASVTTGTAAARAATATAATATTRAASGSTAATATVVSGSTAATAGSDSTAATVTATATASAACATTRAASVSAAVTSYNNIYIVRCTLDVKKFLHNESPSFPRTISVYGQQNSSSHSRGATHMRQTEMFCQHKIIHTNVQRL